MVLFIPIQMSFIAFLQLYSTLLWLNLWPLIYGKMMPRSRHNLFVQKFVVLMFNAFSVLVCTVSVIAVLSPAQAHHTMKGSEQWSDSNRLKAFSHLLALFVASERNWYYIVKENAPGFYSSCLKACLKTLLEHWSLSASNPSLSLNTQTSTLFSLGWTREHIPEKEWLTIKAVVFSTVPSKWRPS